MDEGKGNRRNSSGIFATKALGPKGNFYISLYLVGGTLHALEIFTLLVCSNYLRIVLIASASSQGYFVFFSRI